MTLPFFRNLPLQQVAAAMRRGANRVPDAGPEGQPTASWHSRNKDLFD